MSSDSIAMLRKAGLKEDLAKLAEQHLEHDLNQSDRDILTSAASKLSTHAVIGSLVGLGLGAALGFRLRQNRLQMFNAFKTARKPTHVKFADGTEEPIPDITSLMKPSPIGDILTYTVASIAGLYLGGELGLLSGASSARRTVMKDQETRVRIERAFRSFRADMLKREVAMLEQGEGSIM